MTNATKEIPDYVILEIVTGKKNERGSILPINRIVSNPSCHPISSDSYFTLLLDYVRLSTTVATNTLLERTG
jgi:N-methylhydantoinase A/oxoprolinase/acetone carboxylase beta subunit